MDYYVKFSDESESLSHHGILGMHWGIRRYQNKDGSYTAAGKKRYSDGESTSSSSKRKMSDGEKNVMNQTSLGGSLSNKERSLVSKADSEMKSKANSKEFQETNKEALDKATNALSEQNNIRKEMENNPRLFEYAKNEFKQYDYDLKSTNDMQYLESIENLSRDYYRTTTNTADKALYKKYGESVAAGNKAVSELGSKLLSDLYDDSFSENSRAKNLADATAYDIAQERSEKNKMEHSGYYVIFNDDENSLCHHGILGMKWGIRRYQNKDGSYTSEGKKRYNNKNSSNNFGETNSEGTKYRVKKLINKYADDITDDGRLTKEGYNKFFDNETGTKTEAGIQYDKEQAKNRRYSSSLIDQYRYNKNERTSSVCSLLRNTVSEDNDLKKKIEDLCFKNADDVKKMQEWSNENSRWIHEEFSAGQKFRKNNDFEGAYKFFHDTEDVKGSDAWYATRISENSKKYNDKWENVIYPEAEKIIAQYTKEKGLCQDADSLVRQQVDLAIIESIKKELYKYYEG